MKLASENYRSGQPISEYIQNNLAPHFSPDLINPQHFCHSARRKPVRLSKSGMTAWRVLSTSAQLIVDPASGARGIIRDTCADGAYRFHWSVIPSDQSLPIAAGRTGGLARARSIAEEALRAYAEDWRGLLAGDTEAV